MTMSSLPPTMSNVGAWTFGNASPARSRRPPRETTAPTSFGISAAATHAAPAAVCKEYESSRALRNIQIPGENCSPRVNLHVVHHPNRILIPTLTRLARVVLALRCSATRVRLRHWSARNLRNAGRRPERIQACSDKSSHRLLLRARGKCLADRPALLQQFFRCPVVATP